MDKIDRYSISSRGYLDRAKKRISENTKESLIYAVLEVRCAIEARLQEILEPHNHVSKKQKKSYEIKKLSKTVTKNLCPEDIGSKITIHDGNKTYDLLYIPVSSYLRNFAQTAGDYLHAMQSVFDDKKWHEINSNVHIAIMKLEENLKGNLLGPALLKNDGLANLNIELIDNNEELSELLNTKGKQLSLTVEYFEVQ